MRRWVHRAHSCHVLLTQRIPSSPPFMPCRTSLLPYPADNVPDELLPLSRVARSDLESTIDSPRYVKFRKLRPALPFLRSYKQSQPLLPVSTCTKRSAVMRKNRFTMFLHIWHWSVAVYSYPHTNLGVDGIGNFIYKRRNVWDKIRWSYTFPLF